MYELEREIVRAYGLKATFDELRLGPLLKQPLVEKNFFPDGSLSTVPVITMEEIVAALSEYRFQNKFKNIELGQFLNWLASCRGVSSPRFLCLSMNKYAIGTIIKYCSSAAKSEHLQRDAYFKKLQEDRAELWTRELKERRERCEKEERSGEALSEYGRDAAIRLGALGATEGLRAVALEALEWVSNSGKASKSKRNYNNSDNNINNAALMALCELAALYAITLGNVDTTASRSALASAKGLSDDELSMELIDCLVNMSTDASHEEETTPLGRLARAEALLLDRLRLPSFDCLQVTIFIDNLPLHDLFIYLYDTSYILRLFHCHHLTAFSAVHSSDLLKTELLSMNHSKRGLDSMPITRPLLPMPSVVSTTIMRSHLMIFLR